VTADGAGLQTTFYVLFFEHTERRVKIYFQKNHANFDYEEVAYANKISATQPYGVTTQEN
jgi:hypothetical protein